MGSIKTQRKYKTQIFDIMGSRESSGRFLKKMTKEEKGEDWEGYWMP
jgi:hypothetical protein